MKENNNAASTGVSFDGLLLIAFIVMKLCGVIDWSWWWVLAPLWAPLVILTVVVFVMYTWVLIHK